MITHIRSTGFKGFDIDEDLPEKVIYTGPNMAGKSTRAAIIALALYGHIPFSNVGKRPGDILDSFGQDSLVVSATVNGTEFARKFSRNAKGVVSQSVQINKKKASKENFAIMLHNAGNPRIADVSEFMKQSESKKIDTLFELYPNPELKEVDEEIQAAKEDISRITKKRDGAESTIQRLMASKNDIVIPAGNIAETQAEIKSTEAKISELEEQIKQAEIEEEKIKAEEEGKRKEKERADKEAAEKAEQEAAEKLAEQSDNGQSYIWDQETDPKGDIESIEPNERIPIEPMKTDEEWAQHDLDSPSENPAMVETDKLITKMENDFETHHGKEVIGGTGVKPESMQSIERIIEALKGAGCGTCAALIVAKQELKKYKGV